MNKKHYIAMNGNESVSLQYNPLIFIIYSYELVLKHVII